jgi:hypothetical protein
MAELHTKWPQASTLHIIQDLSCRAGKPQKRRSEELFAMSAVQA